MKKRAYVHNKHLFTLQYASPLLFKILEIYKLNEIPYEKLHKWCIYFIRLLIKLFKFEIQKCGQFLFAHKPYSLFLGSHMYAKISIGRFSNIYRKLITKHKTHFSEFACSMAVLIYPCASRNKL